MESFARTFILPPTILPLDAARLQEAAQILEAVAANRALLAVLSEEDRARFIQAAGEVYCPDVGQRRRLTKATSRQRHAEKQGAAQKVLGQTGIRALRCKPIVTTPNYFLSAPSLESGR